MLYTRTDIRAIQGTLRHEIRCTGYGLHGGNEVTLKILPAPANSGIFFLRRDVEISRALIPASWHNLFDTHPYTVLGNEFGVSISKVEHLLAALRGCGVDNALIEVSSGEVPILDGSSAPLVAMINHAGVIAQGVARQGIYIEHFVAVRSGEHYAYVKPGNLPSITVDGVVPEGSHEPQQVSFSLIDHVFEQEIAPARRPEFRIDAIRRYADEWGHKTGYGTNASRFDDEPARSRTLESLGFLALTEAPIYGQLYFYKPCSFLIDALLHELAAARDTWRRLSYVEIDRLSGYASQHLGQSSSSDRHTG